MRRGGISGKRGDLLLFSLIQDSKILSFQPFDRFALLIVDNDVNLDETRRATQHDSRLFDA